MRLGRVLETAGSMGQEGAGIQSRKLEQQVTGSPGARWSLCEWQAEAKLRGQQEEGQAGVPRMLAGVPLSAGSPSLETHCQVQTWAFWAGAACRSELHSTPPPPPSEATDSPRHLPQQNIWGQMTAKRGARRSRSPMGAAEVRGGGGG